ncbi:MAG: UDP-N-acetylmuramoyl-L-alanine--D-glutamate ligase [Kiritimatiellae bacterium]|nr:UDP-N-acetylmuramoyl-L-alanine--D-glutamate ligase [Kiritimatiellia bacterium]
MYTGTHAVVLGLGTSGESAARLLCSEGVHVTVFDERPDAERSSGLMELGVSVVAASAEQEIPADVDLCVISPGVPLEHEWANRARGRGLRPVPEFELGWSRFRGRVVAVTGSNGKSTSVKFMAEVLERAGFRAAPVGNYGVPVCRAVMERPELDWMVMELSSFQLEAALSFRAEIGILLNLSPNHLDRHGSFEAYSHAKSRLFAHVGDGDICMTPRAWRDRLRGVGGGRGVWRCFGSGAGDDYAWRAGGVFLGEEKVTDLSGSYFDNRITGANAAAVIGGLHAAGISVAEAGSVARAFASLPNRMEFVVESRGVRFVNDSKGTTLAAIAAALEMTGRPTRLIAGGLLKETDLAGVKEMLALHARGVYLVGKAAEKMATAWSSVVSCHRSGTLDRAMSDAWRDAQPGEVILLSPGCASFDQFRNYEERGEVFRRTARALAAECVG